MALVSTDEFLRKGQQVNLDMLNLDSVLRGLYQEKAVPFADYETWGATIAEWNHFYETNVASVPLLPWQSTSDLDTWLTRIESWRAKMQKWALVSSQRSRDIVNALPDSPAIVEHRENPPSAAGTPVWVFLLFGMGMLTAVGYSLGQAARLGQVARGR